MYCTTLYCTLSYCTSWYCTCQYSTLGYSTALVIYIKILDDGFQFYQKGLFRKILESTGMEHCNRFTIHTKVEAPLGIDASGYESNRDWPNSYASIIGMMMYLVSNTRPYISYTVHQCDQFTNNTKASYDTYVKSIFWYLQGIIMVWCLIYPRNWCYFVMLMHILQDFGDMKILSNLSVLGVELDLW